VAGRPRGSAKGPAPRQLCSKRPGAQRAQAVRTKASSARSSLAVDGAARRVSCGTESPRQRRDLLDGFLLGVLLVREPRRLRAQHPHLVLQQPSALPDLLRRPAREQRREALPGQSSGRVAGAAAAAEPHLCHAGERRCCQAVTVRQRLRAASQRNRVGMRLATELSLRRTCIAMISALTSLSSSPQMPSSSASAAALLAAAAVVASASSPGMLDTALHQHTYQDNSAIESERLPSFTE